MEYNRNRRFNFVVKGSHWSGIGVGNLTVTAAGSKAPSGASVAKVFEFRINTMFKTPDPFGF